jgi:hypothetical protein
VNGLGTSDSSGDRGNAVRVATAGNGLTDNGLEVTTMSQPDEEDHGHGVDRVTGNAFLESHRFGRVVSFSFMVS